MHVLASVYFAVIVTSTTCFPLSKSFHDCNLRSVSRSCEQYHKDPLGNNIRWRNSRRFAISRSVLQMTATDMNWDPKSGPKLDFNEDFYSILEIDPEITSKDMKKAYYKIVFKYHPDNKEGKEQKELCNKQMMVINAAYKVLKDGDARAAYDRKRRMGVYGEAAKAGRSSSGSNNGKTQTQPNKQQSQSTRSSGYSSSSSSSDPFGSYGYNQQNDANDATESLGDIFGDFWSEIRKGKTENLVGDLLDFLEDQIPAAGAAASVADNIYSQVTGQSNSRSSSSSGYNSRSDPGSGIPRSKARVDSEVQLIQSATTNLKAHMVDMMKERSELMAKRVPTSSTSTSTSSSSSSSSSSTSSSSSSSSSSKSDDETKVRLREMEENFRKLETVRGLDARIMEVEKQIRQLNRQLQGLLTEQQGFQSSSSSNGNGSRESRERERESGRSRDSETAYSRQEQYRAPPSSSSSSSYTSSSASSRDNNLNNSRTIDEELLKLKKKMGLK